jgi:hypothetical protein
MSGAGKGPVLMLVTDGAKDARLLMDVRRAFSGCHREQCVLEVDCAAAVEATRVAEAATAEAEVASSPALQQIAAAAATAAADQEARGKD